MPKTPAKSPRSISTPSSRGKREAVETPSRKPVNLSAANVEGDGVQEPVVTPARQGGKRKAAAATAANGDDDDGEDESPKPKKPKVYVQESVSTSESKGKRHTRTSVKLEMPVSTPTAKPAAAGKHIVFSNDDEPSEFFTPQEAPAQNILDAQGSKDDGDEEEEEEEEDDDDDDAPEAVSTHAAAAQAAKSAQAATSAAEKQKEVQKRKRQDRDARFREQAEARKKQAAAAEDASASRLGLDQPRGHMAGVAAAAAGGAPPARKKRLDKHSLPAVLPDDFLEAASLDGSGDDEDGGSEAGERKPAPARFNTAARQVARAESRQPRDQRVGSTVYRVMKRQGDARLAPRMGRHSRNAKEALMGRGRPAARKAGFLVKR